MCIRPTHGFEHNDTMVDELAEQLSEIVVSDEYKRVRSERRDKWRQFCRLNRWGTSENEASMNEPHLHVVAACLLLVRWLCCLKHMKQHIDGKANPYIHQRFESSGVFRLRRAVWQLQPLEVGL